MGLGLPFATRLWTFFKPPEVGLPCFFTATSHEGRVGYHASVAVGSSFGVVAVVAAAEAAAAAPNILVTVVLVALVYTTNVSCTG